MSKRNRIIWLDQALDLVDSFLAKIESGDYDTTPSIALNHLKTGLESESTEVEINLTVKKRRSK